MFTDIHLINLRIMAEVLTASHMLSWFLPHKENCVAKIAVSAVICLLAAYLFPLPAFAVHDYIGWGLLMYGSFFAFAVFGIAFCYQETILSILCCVITGYTIHQISSSINGVLSLMIDMLQLSAAPVVPWFISIILIYIPAFLILSRHIKDAGQIRIDNKKLPLLSGLYPKL